MDQSILNLALSALTAAGADKAHASLTSTTQHEINVANGEIVLMRTTRNASLGMRAIVNDCQGASEINDLSEQAVRAGAASAVETARASQPEPANDIAPYDESREMVLGDEQPDQQAIYARLREFLDQARAEFPQVLIDDTNARFTYTERVVGNTNGVRFTEKRGVYGVSLFFTAKEGEKSSSFNYTGYDCWKLDKPIMQTGTVRELLEQAVLQLNPEPMTEKFVGDVLVTPDCLGSVLLWALCFGPMGEFNLISGTSPLKDKLGETIGEPCFTFLCAPTAMPGGHTITGDGFLAKDAPMIENGVLRNYNLSQFGANKTGYPRLPNGGGGFVVTPGDTPLADIIKGIKRGVLLCRFSGGAPASNGDFSGVAKNSFLIEDGKITKPLIETMITGNMLSMLRNIRAISSEHVNDGGQDLPWMAFSGFTISGK